MGAESALIPLFPLPNVVLFPGMPLPLHVFEPRYRDMVRELMEGENRDIGMVLLRGDWKPEYYATPQIFAVGCAGRIVNCETLEDGRYNILIHGTQEFVIESELSDRAYRQGVVRWRPKLAGTLSEGLRDELATHLRELLSNHPNAPAQRILDDPKISDDLFINFFSYALELSPLEKQALLETTSLADRAARLQEVVDFALRTGLATAPSAEADLYH